MYMLSHTNSYILIFVHYLLADLRLIMSPLGGLTILDSGAVVGLGHATKPPSKPPCLTKLLCNKLVDLTVAPSSSTRLDSSKSTTRPGQHVRNDHVGPRALHQP